jgi:Porin PorA
MPARPSRWPIVVGIIGIVLLLGAVLWRFVAQPALVKYPTDLEGDAHAEGTITFFLDPETREPLDPPAEEPLVIDRHLEVDGDESDGDVAVVDEIDEQEIAGQPSELRQRYVIDRTTLENVADDRAFAYDEANVTDRSPAYSINLPFDAGDGPYAVWKNESGESYEFTATDSYEVDGVELTAYEGSADDLPVTDAYVAALAPQGVPTELTLDELRPILAGAGLDLDALLGALLPQLSPDDVQALLAVAEAPVPLSYSLSVETRFGVEPRTGAIVDLSSISQTVGARPDPEAIAPIADVLGRYPQVPEAVGAIETLNGFADGPPIPVFAIDYTQTEDSRSETVEQANDLAGQITLATRTIPLGLLVAGLAAVLVALVGFIMARRRPATPASTEPDREPPATT